MNEITKLYENAEIKPVIRDTAIGKGYYIEHQRIEEYPPFTAEKQLELIKWLGELDYLGLMRTTMETKDWIFNSEYNMSGDIYKNSSRAKTFEETLAKLINTLWQDLTEEDKINIKNILEM